MHCLPSTPIGNMDIHIYIHLSDIVSDIVSNSGTYSSKDIQGRTEIYYTEERIEQYNSKLGQYELRQTISQKNISHDNGANFERTVQIEWTKTENDGKFKITK
ncbi:hypothetical protein MFLAVUS_003952 [Mucor flavus]|uniref:Uncharacterized protein n=1 Tax=Mucor flavus TaxID=439312 RepID=A0ABP9YUJ5_9FUNG